MLGKNPQWCMKQNSVFGMICGEKIRDKEGSHVDSFE